MRKLFIANWKLNPKTHVAAKKLVTETKRALSGVRGAEVVIAPPFPYLADAVKATPGKTVSVGAQDVFWENTGSYTGEVGAKQLKDIGVKTVIVGHSERRQLGETDEMVSRKVSALLAEQMRPIVCIGESERDSGGRYLSFLERQLSAAFDGVSKERAKRVVVAYEPIWAIGKSSRDAIDAHMLHETVLYIRKILSKHYPEKTAFGVPILYGGSVEPENAKALMADGMVNGFLVGHASLVAKDFAAIIKSTL